MNIVIPQDLIDLNTLFNKHGYQLRVVGGACRDSIIGIVPKDLDFCTDANPDEQRMVYDAEGVRYVETGLSHGTLSTIFDHVAYEITSLRIDTECDGRHAVVNYVGGNGQQTLDDKLLQKFIDLGYDAENEYDVDELTAVFRRISQSD